MKTGVLIFSLMFAVASSESVLECVQDYSRCAVPLVNNWKNPVKCSLLVTFTECITNVTERCYTNQAPFFKRFAYVLKKVCYVDQEEIEEWQNAANCVLQNSDTFRSCSKDPDMDVCNATSSILECTSKNMHEKCGKLVGELFDELKNPLNILAAECSKVISGYNEATKCLAKSGTNFLSCKLEGELKTVGDICSSVNGFYQCALEKALDKCGPEAQNLTQIYTKSFDFAMFLCENIQKISEIAIPECSRGILKCNVGIFNVDELKCMDVSNYVGCMADSTKGCVEEWNRLPVIVLEKYKTKFPVYCDMESSFNKSIICHLAVCSLDNLQTEYVTYTATYVTLDIQKESTCISEKVNEVAVPCYGKLQGDLDEVQMIDYTGILRSYVNFLSCLSRSYGEKCSKGAQEAVNDLLQPLGDSLDESCRMLTGKRCNGACGLQVATWIFIASLTYLLTRKHD